MKSRRLLTHLALILLLCALSSVYSYARIDIKRLDQFKAVFLYNFTLFIEWPDEEALGNIDICLWGRSPLVGVLKKIVPEKIVRNNPLQMQVVENLDQAITCQLVFFGTRAHSNNKKLEDLLQKLAKKSVLTVSDIRGFAAEGGTIEFFLENNKLRFIINKIKLREAHLKASSKLLDMAVLFGE